MKVLRTLLSMFRRPDRSRDGYEAEVQFAGWVNLPPLFRELTEERPASPDSKRVTSA